MDRRCLRQATALKTNVAARTIRHPAADTIGIADGEDAGHGIDEMTARIPSRVRLVEQIQRCGVDFFNVACQHDLDGIVAKWAVGTYQTTCRTSRLKIRNPKYSQWTGLCELFDAKRSVHN